MKTNMMIVTAAISAGVAEGLKKRMQGGSFDSKVDFLSDMLPGLSKVQVREALLANNGNQDHALNALFSLQPQVQNQQVVQQEDQTTRAYAQSLYDAASDYTDELTWNGKPGDKFSLLHQYQCPKELRTMLKDNQGNYIVLVGEEHYNGDGVIDGFHGTVQAEKVLTALQAKPEGVNGIAAIELPILEDEDEPQYLKHNKDATCTNYVGIPTMQKVEVKANKNKMSKQKETKEIPNCKVATAFEDEIADFVSDKTVVGSGAGRDDAFALQDDELYKYGTKPKLKAEDYGGSINHSVMTKKADLQDAGVEIKGGEPAKAFFEGTKVKNRNLWAAQRLSKLAKHDQNKNTVVLMPYGAGHLCAYGNANYPSLTTQGQLQSLGWQCVQGCGFGDSELYDFNYIPELRQMKRDIPDLDVKRAKSALNTTYGDVEAAKDIYNQGQQNQQQQGFQYAEELQTLIAIGCDEEKAKQALIAYPPVQGNIQAAYTYYGTLII